MWICRSRLLEVETRVRQEARFLRVRGSFLWDTDFGVGMSREKRQDAEMDDAMTCVKGKVLVSRA